MGRRIVLPGDYLSSAEEAEPGQNTYSERDEIFSATMGEDQSAAGTAAVRSKTRNLPLPHVGMEVYGVVIKSSPNKAVVGCIPVSEAEGHGRGIEMDVVIPVTAVRRGYVNDMRDEIKIGDIVRARIKSVEKTGCEATIQPKECGIVACFCPRCRSRMDLHDTLFICPHCNWKERRKLVGTDEGGERGGFRSREGGGFRDRGPPRGGGFRGREGGRGFRPREGGGFRDRGPPRDRYPPRGPRDASTGSPGDPGEGRFVPREQREGGYEQHDSREHGERRYPPRENEGGYSRRESESGSYRSEGGESGGYRSGESGGYSGDSQQRDYPRERREQGPGDYAQHGQREGGAGQYQPREGGYAREGGQHGRPPRRRYEYGR